MNQIFFSTTTIYSNKYEIFKLVAPLSLAHIGTRLLHQISLEYITVSFTHTVKSTSPIFAIVVSRIITGEKHSLKVMLSVIPIIAGVSMASLTEISFNALGFMAAIFGTITLTWLNVGTKQVLMTKKMNQVELLLYTDIVAVFLLIPAWLLMEGNGLFIVVQNSAAYGVLILINGCCYFLQVLSAFTMLDLVSNLTYSIISVSKRVFIIMGSVLYFANPVSIPNAIGTSVAIFGVFMYSQIRLQELGSQANLSHDKLDTSIL